MGLIEQAPVSTFRSPTVVAGTLAVKVPLHASVSRVQAGTPLRSRAGGGWEIAKDGLGEIVSAEGQWGGDICACWRQAVVDFHLPKADGYEVGAHYRVADVDDRGIPEFELDPRGVYVALDHTTMLMDMTIAALHAAAHRKGA